MHDGPEGSGEKEEVVLGISSFSESEGGRRVGVRGKTPLSRSMDQDRGGVGRGSLDDQPNPFLSGV